MYKLIFPESYTKKAKRFFSKHHEILTQYEKVLLLLQINPFHNSLRLHKIKEIYSVSINMKYRILVDIIITDNEIIFIDIGSHDIYR